LREVRRFAGGMIGLSLMAVLLTQVDKLLLSRLLPLTQFAYFMLGSLVSSGLYMVVSPVVVAIFPTFVRLFSDDNEAGLAAAYHKASQLVTVLLAPITILLVAFPRGVLFAWSGDRVLADHTAPIMALLAVGTFLNGLIQVPHQLQLAAGWTSLALRMNLIAVVILIPALIWAVPHYGPVAAAAIWALLNGVYLLIGIPLLHRRMLKAEMRRWYVGDLIIPMCGAGAVVLLALVFQPQEAASRLAWLAFLIATGLVAVTGAVFCASELRPRAIEISTAMFEKYRWT
jgi:O-antigen/teichoic acid export membrane protein